MDNTELLQKVLTDRFDSSSTLSSLELDQTEEIARVKVEITRQVRYELAKSPIVSEHF